MKQTILFIEYFDMDIPYIRIKKADLTDLLPYIFRK